jgi:hypothetical protein
MGRRQKSGWYDMKDTWVLIENLSFETFEAWTSKSVDFEESKFEDSRHNSPILKIGVSTSLWRLSHFDNASKLKTWLSIVSNLVVTQNSSLGLSNSSFDTNLFFTHSGQHTMACGLYKYSRARTVVKRTQLGLSARNLRSSLACNTDLSSSILNLYSEKNWFIIRL